MYLRELWKGLLAIVLLSAIGYGALACYLTIHYHQLSEKTTLSAPIFWEIVEKSDDDYMLASTYQYSIEGRPFSGKMLWNQTHYLNRYAAEQAIKDLDKERFTLWYNGHNPKDSSLEKHYPYKEWIYAAILSAIFFYLLLLYRKCLKFGFWQRKNPRDRTIGTNPI